MEKFNPDEKMLVLMKLPPQEVLVVCETSREMNVSCRNSKYNLMWENKIKQDFNVDKEGSYEKYKFLKQLYEEKFYVVLAIDEYIPDSFSKIFDSEEKAEKYIYAQLNGEYSYAAMKSALNTHSLKYGSKTYELQEVEMNKESIDFLDDSFNKEKEEYERNVEKLKEIDEDMIANVEDFVTDFNSDFSEGIRSVTKVTKTKNKINKFVKEIDEEFELAEKKALFRDMVINSLLVDNDDKESLREN